jgi:hypothetical protein
LASRTFSSGLRLFREEIGKIIFGESVPVGLKERRDKS